MMMPARDGAHCECEFLAALLQCDNVRLPAGEDDRQIGGELTAAIGIE